MNIYIYIYIYIDGDGAPGKLLCVCTESRPASKWKESGKAIRTESCGEELNLMRPAKSSS
jgi:hypothetical protein